MPANSTRLEPPQETTMTEHLVTNSTVLQSTGGGPSPQDQIDARSQQTSQSRITRSRQNDISKDYTHLWCPRFAVCDEGDDDEPDSVFTGVQDDSAGYLVLGRGTSRSRRDEDWGTSASDDEYTMNYTIDHIEQSRHLGKEAMFDECVPCYNVEAERTVGGWAWSFFRSEAFLYRFFFHLHSSLVKSNNFNFQPQNYK